MADSVYDLAVKLSIETAGIAGAAGMAMRAFGGIESQALRADRSVQNLTQRMAMQGMSSAQRQAYLYTEAINAQTAAHDKLNQAMKGTALLAGGALLVGAGVGLLGWMDAAEKKAASLQTLMTQVQLATGATAGQMAGLQTLAVRQGTQTQSSLIDEAGILRTMTMAGIAGPGSANRLRDTLPAVSRYAEVMRMARGAGVNESATIAVELAHLYGQWNPKAGPNGPGVNSMIDLASRAMAVSPGSQREFYTTLSQMTGQMRPLYGTDQAGRTRFIKDSLALTMLESQLGQQGRGGTQVASMLGRTLGAGSTAFGARTKTQDKDLAALTTLANRGGSHLSFFNKAGSFSGMSDFLTILERAATAPGESPQRIGQLFRGAFGAVGLRQAGILADPITVSQFGKVGQFLDPKTGGVSLAAQQAAYNATPEGQARSSQKNWETLTTLIGQDFVPVMTAALTATAGVTGALATLAGTSPGLTHLVGGVLALTTGLTVVSGVVMGVRGAFLLWGAAGEALGLAKLAKGIGVVTGLIRTQGVVTVVSTGITKVWAATQAAGAAVAGAAAGVYGVLDAAVIALSGGFSIAAIAAGLLDIALSPITLTVLGIGLAVGGVILVWQHWGQIVAFVTDKLHAFTVASNNLSHSKNPLVSAAGQVGQGLADPYNPGAALGAGVRTFVHDHLHIGGGASPEHWAPPTLTPTPMARAAHGPSPRHGATPPINLGGVHIGAVHVHDAGAKSAPQLAKEIIEQLPRKALDHIARHVKESIGMDTTMGQQYQASQFTGLELAGLAF